MSDIVKELDNEFKKAEHLLRRKDVLSVFCISNEVTRIDITIPPSGAKGLDSE